MRDVSFAHHGRDPVVDGFDLDVARGELHVLEGPSGGGKSTLLRLACGLIPRVQGGRIAGEITIGGQPVDELPVREIPQRIGWVPQDPETSFTARTVRLELSGLARNLGLADPERRAREALDGFEAGHLVDREVEQLSGGQAQRVALAAAFLGEPDGLVLDEPTAQLDQSGRKLLAERVGRARKRGQAVLVAAHPPHPFGDLADRVHRIGEEHDQHPEVSMPAADEGQRLALVDRAVHAYEDGPRLGPLDLELRAGEIVHLAGSNGSGKTTLLHLLAGLLEPEEGTVRIHGDAPGAIDATAWAQRAGIAFQHPAWHITQDTVREEVTFTSERIDRPVEAGPWLERLGLDGLGDAHPWDLSGGQRQRQAVATACAHEPDVLLLDEPTRGLDRASRNRLAGLLAYRARVGKATLVASHHPWLGELAHRTVSLDGGGPA
jgi:energy-coupling factor transport system ATP-binding protein